MVVFPSHIQGTGNTSFATDDTNTEGWYHCRYQVSRLTDIPKCCGYGMYLPRLRSSRVPSEANHSGKKRGSSVIFACMGPCLDV